MKTSTRVESRDVLKVIGTKDKKRNDLILHFKLHEKVEFRNLHNLMLLLLV